MEAALRASIDNRKDNTQHHAYTHTHLQES